MLPSSLRYPSGGLQNNDSGYRNGKTKGFVDWGFGAFQAYCDLVRHGRDREEAGFDDGCGCDRKSVVDDLERRTRIQWPRSETISDARVMTAQALPDALFVAVPTAASKVTACPNAPRRNANFALTTPSRPARELLQDRAVDPRRRSAYSTDTASTFLITASAPLGLRPPSHLSRISSRSSLAPLAVRMSWHSARTSFASMSLISLRHRRAGSTGGVQRYSCGQRRGVSWA